MKQHDVINFLGVSRCVGYAAALIAAALTLGLLLLAPVLGLPRDVLVPSLVQVVMGGLALAWIAALTRWLVRRMTFETAGEH
ncbi:MAG: hypothetical protein A2579_00495 [Lysobacterales bacterium RIFOXYD1_FULL_69_11]|nr:MAG: hypothetical protein A2190_00735 [Xanthomonadales bacterium RIFOXYA1_FULL_69_10]OHE86365.1 MAG: hypothetical protein A2579_00495 [Xanthomonadales bacterium RIFOXYD1_FULL_69_11]